MNETELEAIMGPILDDAFQVISDRAGFEGVDISKLIFMYETDTPPEPYEGCGKRGGICDCGEDRPCAVDPMVSLVAYPTSIVGSEVTGLASELIAPLIFDEAGLDIRLHDMIEEAERNIDTE